MTALSDALVAAQARAVAALSKAYVADEVEIDDVAKAMENMGLTDPVERKHWLNALAIIKSLGAAAPVEAKPHTNGAEQPASAKQLDLIRTLCERKQVSLPDDLDSFTKVQASEAIDQLQRV